MYYKEEWINGKLFWKASPSGEWIEFTKQQYAERLLKVESELKNSQLGDVSGQSEQLFCHHNGSYTSTKDENGLEWCCKCKCRVVK